jgi:hypothetical protein
MKIPRTAVLSVLVLLLATTTAASAYDRGPRVAVNISLFFDELAPYGHWYESPSYGWVWAPAGVSASWRPYLDGHWVYTEVGWTWVSDDPWGWAAYHYGRWYFDPVLGWVWVPDTEWAPAWVSFYYGDGWIGWSPLPPGTGFRAGFSFAAHPRSFCFVPERRFLDPHVDRFAAPVAHNQTLLRRTRNVTRFATVNRTVVNRGVPVERIARARRRAVPTHRVVDVGAAREVERARVRGREVPMFRPRVRAERPSHPPVVRSARDRRPRADEPRGVRGGRGRPGVAAQRERASAEARARVGPDRRRQSAAARIEARGRRFETTPQRIPPRRAERPAEQRRRPPRARPPQMTRGSAPRDRDEVATLRRGRPQAPRRQAAMSQARTGPRQEQVVRRPQPRQRAQQFVERRPQRARPQQQVERRPQHRERPPQAVARAQRERQPAVRRGQGRPGGGRQAHPPQGQRRRAQQQGRGRPPGP